MPSPIALLLLAGPTVWVVDPIMAPGAHFPDVQSAIDAAADGDVILMRFGGYAGFTVDGKSLAIIEDEFFGFGATVFGEVVVRNLAADQEVTIRGIEIDPLDFFAPKRELLIELCEGPVLLHNVTLVRGNPCLEVEFSGVTLSDCSLAGSSSGSTTQEPVGMGLSASSSTVNLYYCDVSGGSGADDYPPTHPGLPDAGADAVRLAQSAFYSASSMLQGGAGGDGALSPTGFCTPGAAGGYGVRVLDANTSVVIQGSSSYGGAGGAAGGPGCAAGATGAAYGPILSGVVQAPGVGRELTVNTPVREGGVVSIDVLGQVGELVVLLVSDALLAWPYDPGLNGTLVAHPVLSVAVVLGSAGGDGHVQANFGFPVGKLPPGVQGRHHTLQAAMIFLPTLKLTVTSPAALLLLDQGF